MKPGLLASALALVVGLAASGSQAHPLAAGLGQNVAGAGSLPLDAAQLPEPITHNGRDIFASFREGLAAPTCDTEATAPRWQAQFAHAPARLANADDDALILFGYVVEELRAANLPTEFALIPFVESGYRPSARNRSGPAGLWQFIATTARNHKVPMQPGYDGRLSAIESTQAAVRYLKTLHGMFGGDWRLAVMAYNAGEYRILQSLRRGGMNAQNARPAELPGLSPITYAYVEKLHALACVLEQAETDPQIMASLDREVPILRAHSLPAGTTLQQWAQRQDLDPAAVARLNPALASAGPRTLAQARVLAPALLDVPGASDTQDTAIADTADVAVAAAADAPAVVAASTPGTTRGKAVAAASAPATRRRHTVRSGESAWTIARRYGVSVKQLLVANDLDSRAVLRPGTVLTLD